MGTVTKQPRALRGRGPNQNPVFRRWFSRKAVPLTGAPAVRRLKTYSAQSGYVYQYYYEGHRPFERARDSGVEYVFDVSADRKTSMPVSVFLGAACLQDWEGNHARTLNSTERYAIAKMALFQAFDERPHPDQMKLEIHVRGADIDGILAALGLD